MTVELWLGWLGCKTSRIDGVAHILTTDSSISDKMIVNQILLLL